MDVELNDKAAFDATRYQLLSLVDKNALLHQAQVEWQLLDAIKILVEDQKLEVLCACEVEMECGTIADAADLSVSFIEALGLRCVLGRAELKDSLKNALSCLRVPHMNALLVVRGKTSCLGVVDNT